jgi:sucrose phosphorylase
VDVDVALDEVAPDVMIITETNVPHKENISYFGDGTDEAQMVYNFTLPPLLLYTLISGESKLLREWVNTLETPSSRATFYNFTASHDGVGVRPVEGILADQDLNALIEHIKGQGGQVSYKQNSDGSESPYEMNITYVDALNGPELSEELHLRRFIMSQAIALSLAGVPAIYIHSLLGTRNNAIGFQKTGVKRAINRPQLDVDKVVSEIQNKGNLKSLVFHRYVELLKVRISESVFHPNSQQYAVDIRNDNIFALQRTDISGKRVLCVYNITGVDQVVNLGNDWCEAADLLEPGFVTEGDFVLEPYQFRWLNHEPRTE